MNTPKSWPVVLILAFGVAAFAAEKETDKQCTAFSWQAFREPPPQFWPGYFWILNDKVDDATLLGQLRDMRSHDARSVCILPLPPAFRPDTFGTRLDRPYLGESYFQMIRTIVAECERLGMHFWLYDEGGWPSGGACGQVYQRNPERFAPKYLVSRTIRLDAGKQYKVPAEAVCAAVRAEDSWRIHRPGEKIDAPEGGTTVRLFRVAQALTNRLGGRRAQHVDLLCEEATRTFIELTHQRYKDHVGGVFGKTIRWTFTDEPKVRSTRPPGSLTWTDDLPEVFRTRKGYDLLPWLPRLLAPAAEGEKARLCPARTRVLVDFYDVWSNLFVQRYLAPIRQWCAANGLQSAGHFGGEDEPVYSAIGGYGHILRALRGLDLPGTDTIWRQTFPGVRSHPYAKYASSVARQKGQPYVVTESFAVYGAGLTPAEMKWVTDHQYVRGSNLTIISNYPYSTRSHFMPGCRPHFGRTYPLWRFMDLYHGYTARLGYLLSRGRAVCSTAVYYDVRSIWAGEPWRSRAIRLHEELAVALLGRQREFDFIDDDVLSGRQGRIEGGQLVVGPMHYDTVIVPATKWMELPALEGLVDFARSGGTVIAVEGLPQSDCGKRALLDVAKIPKPVNRKEIALGRGRVVTLPLDQAAVMPPPLVRLDPPLPGIRVCKRTRDETALYFLVNETDRPLSVKATFQERKPAVVCNPENGERYPLATTVVSEGTAAKLTLPSWGSLAIVFGAEADSPAPQAGEKVLLTIGSGWTLRPLRVYRVGEEDYEVSSLPNAEAQPVELGDWRETLGPHFSGDAEYAIRFDYSGKRPPRNARLDLGNVRYACEVILNGQTVGRRVWAPFRVNLEGKLRPGSNDLRVVVTNTLANALLKPAVRERWKKMKGPGWPSSGLYYDTKASAFEKCSLPSGLFGPVRVLK